MRTDFQFKRCDGFQTETSLLPRMVLIAAYRDEKLDEQTRSGRGKMRAPALAEGALPAVRRWQHQVLEQELGLPDLVNLPAALAALACSRGGMRADCAVRTGLIYHLSGRLGLCKADFSRLVAAFGSDVVRTVIEGTPLPAAPGVEADVPSNTVIRATGEFGLWLHLCASPHIAAWEQLTLCPAPEGAVIARQSLAAAAREAVHQLGLGLS